MITKALRKLLPNSEVMGSTEPDYARIVFPDRNTMGVTAESGKYKCYIAHYLHPNEAQLKQLVAILTDIGGDE